MHTIEQLQSGQLKGVIRLELKQGLTEFPLEIIDLADSLEVLDLSDNQLSDLPDSFAQLQQLRILFLTNNCFTTIPAVLALCPKLEMISFRANKLQHIPEQALPDDTRWLILTDNNLSKLPADMGRLHRLQKLALAGNKLTSLPASMANCHNLELARLSANALVTLPDWLFQLPKLSWLAIDGNSVDECSLELSADVDVDVDVENTTIPLVKLEDIELKEVIGQGASGVIYRAKWIKQPHSLNCTDTYIAVKIFKGEVTSDGYPQDELQNCLQAGHHKNLIKVIAQINQADNLGLVMELIPSRFANLGLPPSLQTCTRDTFANGSSLGLKAILLMLQQMASGLLHLHDHQVSHGDIYAHNTMYNGSADILFGDFGAATNLTTLPLLQREAMQSIEVRAFGCLIEDLLEHCLNIESLNVEDLKTASLTPQLNSQTVLIFQTVLAELTKLKTDCMQQDLALRPRFNEIAHLLQQSLTRIETKLTAAI